MSYKIELAVLVLTLVLMVLPVAILVHTVTLDWVQRFCTMF